MRRFFISPDQLSRPRPYIDGADARHLRVVLRSRPGDTIEVLDGQGNQYAARIVALDREKVHLSLGPPQPPETAPDLEITLAQGFLKDKKMDLLVRQLTELGVTRWLPFNAARSVPAPDHRRMANRRDRWQKITLEAVKQCKRRRPMTIDPVASFRQTLEQARPFDLKIAFWEGRANSNPLPTTLEKPRTAFILIGPEGGLESHEIHQAEQAGFRIMGMGPRILRAETATLAAAVMIQFLFGDMGQKPLDNTQAL